MNLPAKLLNDPTCSQSLRRLPVENQGGRPLLFQRELVKDGPLFPRLKFTGRVKMREPAPTVSDSFSLQLSNLTEKWTRAL